LILDRERHHRPCSVLSCCHRCNHPIQPFNALAYSPAYQHASVSPYHLVGKPTHDAHAPFRPLLIAGPLCCSTLWSASPPSCTLELTPLVSVSESQSAQKHMRTNRTMSMSMGMHQRSQLRVLACNMSALHHQRSCPSDDWSVDSSILSTGCDLLPLLYQFHGCFCPASSLRYDMVPSHDQLVQTLSLTLAIMPPSYDLRCNPYPSHSSNAF